VRSESDGGKTVLRDLHMRKAERGCRVISALRSRLWRLLQLKPGRRNSTSADRPAARSDEGSPLWHSVFRARRSKEHASMDCHRRSEEHTSELQSRFDLVCRLL